MPGFGFPSMMGGFQMAPPAQLSDQGAGAMTKSAMDLLQELNKPQTPTGQAFGAGQPMPIDPNANQSPFGPAFGGNQNFMQNGMLAQLIQRLMGGGMPNRGPAFSAGTMGGTGGLLGGTTGLT